jgi:hypothetical protein
MGEKITYQDNNILHEPHRYWPELEKNILMKVNTVLGCCVNYAHMDVTFEAR